MRKTHRDKLTWGLALVRKILCYPYLTGLMELRHLMEHGSV